MGLDIAGNKVLLRTIGDLYPFQVWRERFSDINNPIIQ
jgi:hypothetical protein